MNMHTKLRIVVALLVASWGICSAQISSVTPWDSLDRLAYGEDSGTDLSSVLNAIENQSGSEKLQHWNELFSIARDQEVHSRIRLSVFQFMLTDAILNQPQASDCIAVAGAGLDDVNGDDGVISQTSTALIASLIDSQQPKGNAGVILLEEEEFAEFLVSVGQSNVDGRIRFAAGQLIADSRMPDEMADRAALAWISGRPKATQIDPEILTRLSEDSIGTLRATVELSSADDEFHFAAASALAHIGDESALPILREKLESMHGADAGYLAWFVRQIEVQQSQEKMIEFIAANDKFGIRAREWSIRRASQLDMDQSAIRNGILQFTSDFNGKAFELTELRRIAVDLGYIQPDELVWVPDPIFVK